MRATAAQMTQMVVPMMSKRVVMMVWNMVIIMSEGLRWVSASDGTR